MHNIELETESKIFGNEYKNLMTSKNSIIDDSSTRL